MRLKYIGNRLAIAATEISARCIYHDVSARTERNAQGICRRQLRSSHLLGAEHMQYRGVDEHIESGHERDTAEYGPDDIAFGRVHFLGEVRRRVPPGIGHLNCA